jgi:hypothetical protein
MWRLLGCVAGRAKKADARLCQPRDRRLEIMGANAVAIEMVGSCKCYACAIRNREALYKYRAVPVCLHCNPAEQRVEVATWRLLHGLQVTQVAGLAKPRAKIQTH